MQQNYKPNPTMATIPMRMSLSTPNSFLSSTKTLFSIHTKNSITNNIKTRTKLFLLCSSSRNGTQCPVPLEQQPINEYQSLSTSFPFSWAAGDVVEFGSRLFVVGFSFALVVGLPVAWFGTVGAQAEAAKRIVCAASSGVLAVTFAVVRMYLGWAYVGNRLLSATVEYEETGWYDGQIWVKTPEVLARDRLLGSFSVKPVLGRLKITLVGLAACLVACALIFINIDESYLKSRETGVRAIPGAYNDESARSFEPDAFCGEPDLQE